MLNKTTTDLQKSRYILKTILDDGKTTMQLNKLEDHEIYLLANRGVYYRLEKEEFKDK